VVAMSPCPMIRRGTGAGTMLVRRLLKDRAGRAR
jgi:hypothetical protein